MYYCRKRETNNAVRALLYRKSLNNSYNKIVMHIFISFYPFPWSYVHPSTGPWNLQELWSAEEDNNVDHQPLESLTVRNVMLVVLDSSFSPEMHLVYFFYACQHSFTPFLFFNGLNSSVLQMYLLHMVPFMYIRYNFCVLFLSLKSVLTSSRSLFLKLTSDEWLPVPRRCCSSYHSIPSCLCNTPRLSAHQILCCCTRPLFLCPLSLCQSLKHLIWHSIIACYCQLYKMMIVPCRDKQK